MHRVYDKPKTLYMTSSKASTPTSTPSYLEINPSDFENAIEAMKEAFIESYPEPLDEEDYECIQNLSEKFAELARQYLSPIHEALLTKFVSVRALSSPSTPRSSGKKSGENVERPLAKARSSAKFQHILSQIPPTSKQLHAYTVWQKARVHGLIPPNSVYKDMCPDEASKKRFYNQYVLKIISIDPGAAKAVLETIKQSTELQTSSFETSWQNKSVERKDRPPNHFELFRRDFCKQNPKPTIPQLRDGWAALSADEQRAYMIKASQEI